LDARADSDQGAIITGCGEEFRHSWAVKAAKATAMALTKASIWRRLSKGGFELGEGHFDRIEVR